MIRLFTAVCLLSVASLAAQDEAPAPKLVQASATEEVVALAGKPAIVEGKVNRIGSTSGGGITFLNMGPGVNGFVAVIFKPDYEAFPEGVDKYRGQILRVTGKVELYKETTPQIVVKSPDQIEIMPAPEPAEEAAAE